jgi:Bacterial pre-peptidase C-terminal domain
MTNALRIALWCKCLLVALFMLLASSSRGQLPSAELISVFPSGGKVATNVDLSITGVDIDDAASLIFSHPGITAIPKLGPAGPGGKLPQPLPKQFAATISASVPTGVYEVRAVGKYGVSNPRAFIVGNLNEVDGRQAGATVAAAKEVPLESSISGQATGERADFFRFSAKKDQRILIDCWAHRLDSKMDPAIVLLDASGHEVARAKERQHRDLMLDYLVPADGAFVVKLYDFLYKGGGEYFYRLDVSTSPHVDFIMPPAGLAGTKNRYTIYGRNLPNSTPSDFKTSDDKPLDRLETEIQLPSDPTEQQRLPINSVVEPSESFLDAYAYRLPTPRGDANPVNIFFATAPIAPEQEPNDTPQQAQKINPPCEIVGQFNPRGDQDFYTFEAKKGEIYWIEVYSQRMGMTTDPYLLVQRVKRNDKGVEEASDVAEADDPQPNGKHERLESQYDVLGNDPSLRFTAPEDGTYRLLVRDLYYQSRGNPRFVYRLAVRRENPDFRVVAVAEPPQDPENPNRIPMWTPLLHKGESTGVPVVAMRRDNFNGEIQIGVEGLPEGISCPGATLGPGADVSTLVFSASDKVGPWSGMPKVVGKATINGANVTREVRSGTIVWTVNNREQEPMHFRMCSQLPLSVCGSDVPVTAIQLGDGKPLETAIGGKLQISVKVTRRGEFNGNLRLIPAGLPREMKIPEANIAGGATDGNLQVDVRGGVPVGAYTFACRVSTRVKYRHNPEAAAAAAAAAKEADKIATEAAAAAKKATDEKAAAEKAIADTAAAVKQSADALTAATKASADAQSKLKPAQDAKAAAQKTADEAAAKLTAATSAKETVDKKPAESDDAKAKALAEEKKAAEDALKQATEKNAQAAAKLATAEKAVKDVEAAIAATAAGKTAAEQASADAAAKAKAAADAKPPLEAAATAAAEKSKAAEAEKQAANQRAQQANQIANPRDVLAIWYSTPITVKVAATPIALSLTAPAGPAKPGDKIEIPFTLGRLYGFNDAVTVGLADPNASPGVHISEVSIPPGQAQAKLLVELDPTVSLGEHPIAIRAKLNFNGQPSQLDQPLTLTVAAPPEEKKPEPEKKPDEKKPDADKKPATPEKK